MERLLYLVRLLRSRRAQRPAAFELLNLLLYYVKTVTNALGHTAEFAYDAGLGVLLEQKDPNDLKTRYSYNGKGLLDVISIRGPEDNDFLQHRRISYNDLDLPDKQHVEIQELVDRDGNWRTTKQYFDGLGRTYREVADGNYDSNNENVENYYLTVYSFDDVNRVSGKSNPVPVDGNGNMLIQPSYTQYAYDFAGRPITVTNPDGTVSSYSYNSSITAEKAVQSVTVTDPEGNYKTKEYDSKGRIVKVNDAGIASVKYNYEEDAFRVSITDADGLVSKIISDSLGRKVTLEDPNSGLWSYIYDKNGNLKKQTDPKQASISFAYDASNRVVKKDLPDSDTDVVYTYDGTEDSAKSHVIGQLTGVTDASGTVSSYYDQYGNRKAWIRTVDAGKDDAMSFSFSAEYDIRNQLKTLDYPDGSQIRNYYSPAGFLRMVRLMRTDRGTIDKPVSEDDQIVNGNFGA